METNALAYVMTSLLRHHTKHHVAWPGVDLLYTSLVYVVQVQMLRLLWGLMLTLILLKYAVVLVMLTYNITITESAPHLQTVALI